MTTLRRPHLQRWNDLSPPSTEHPIVILVHGILSDSSTFAKLISLLTDRISEKKFDYWIFDYDYLQPLTTSGDNLAQAIRAQGFGGRRVNIVGHSMGGLVARMAVLRHNLPNVHRLVTLATPNHGTISGTQINLLGQMTTFAFRRLEPVYARAAGILDLTNAHAIMRAEMDKMHALSPSNLQNKSYVSIPAQYFHNLKQIGNLPPSILMGKITLAIRILNFITKFRIKLKPVHDGIVEERSNQIHPAPTGSISEGDYMYSRSEPDQRILHVTHDAGSNCDHVTVTTNPDIADLIHAVLAAETLDHAGIDPLLPTPKGKVKLRPIVI